jgi:hypothetical protein
MTSQLNVDTIVDKAGSGGTNVKVGNTSTYVSDGGSATQDLVESLLKAYTHGSNSAALPSSFNIASGTDNGTGDYIYAFTNNMSSINYAITTSCHSAGLAATNRDSQATASYKVQVFTRGDSTLGSASDQVNYSAIHGDLA